MPSLTSLLAFALGFPPGGREVRRGVRWQRPDATLAYGAHPLQQLDVYRAGDGPRPLLAFLHGGAWQFGDKARRQSDRKAAFAHGEGWHFASLNFRLVPEVSVAEMAQDAAVGLARLLAEAGTLGIDPRRIVLMGHSSGAQLAALVGTDPRYLGEAGFGLDALVGVIANDGVGYDTRERSLRTEWLHRRLIAPAFPSPEQVDLSAVHHAATSPNAGAFLLLHAGRNLGTRHASLLESALRAAGTPVERHGFPGRSPRAHVRLSRKFGAAGFPATEVAREWVAGGVRPLERLRHPGLELVRATQRGGIFGLGQGRHRAPALAAQLRRRGSIVP